METIGQGSYGIVHKAVWHGSILAAKVVALPSADRDEVMKEIEIIRYMHVFVWYTSTMLIVH